METLANLESFVRSARHGSFSEAARRLSLSPAAVSRNIAILERNLGVRLFQRTTRKLSLTAEGESFLASISGSLETIQAAIEQTATGRAEPGGTLRISLAPTFGVEHVLPLVPGFVARYPQVRPEIHLEMRAVDIVAEGYDVAIGGGFDLAPGIVARTLAPAHLVAVASPDYLARRKPPTEPDGLTEHDGILLRSPRTGRIHRWTMRDESGREVSASLGETFVFNDARAMREAALLGLGVAMLAIPDVVSALETGALVRLLPRWYADAGSISIYHASREQLPRRTRAFVDWIVEAFGARRLARRFTANLAREGRRKSR